MRFLLILLIGLAFAAPVFGDAATLDIGKWRKTADLTTAAPGCASTINPGTTCFFHFGSGTLNTASATTKGINIGGQGAIMCFAPDLLAAGGTATATIFTTTVNHLDVAGFAVPSGILDGTNCYTLAPGLFHVHFTVVAPERSALRVEGI